MRITVFPPHFFDILFHIILPETIKAQLIHGFEHIGMHIIALKADMVVMPDIVGFIGKPSPSGNYRSGIRNDVKVYQGIHTGHFMIFFLFA